MPGISKAHGYARHTLCAGICEEHIEHKVCQEYLKHNMYTEHKVQQYARKPRAMGMPGIPYVLEYVLEYFVQKVCQEYLV